MELQVQELEVREKGINRKQELRKTVNEIKKIKVADDSETWTVQEIKSMIQWKGGKRQIPSRREELVCLWESKYKLLKDIPRERRKKRDEKDLNCVTETLHVLKKRECTREQLNSIQSICRPSY